MSLILLVLSTLLVTHTSADYAGIWWWTWSTTTTPGTTNLNIAFSGQVDPDLAVSDSNNIYSKLKGERYLSLGGGNSAGSWTSAALTKITGYCNNRNANIMKYTGISFDIEEGEAGLLTPFANAFRACKSVGLKIIVTVSHSTPYGPSDRVALMNGIISNKDVDILSPQLYTTGSEGTNDYTTNGIPWTSYKSFTGSGGIVPSIVTSSLYASAKTQFSTYGITLKGYIQWSQTGPGSAATVKVRCGTSWDDANSFCSRPGCPLMVDSQCPTGMHCYGSLTPCAGADMADTTSAQVNDNGLTQLQVGLMVGACVILVVVLVVLVVLVLKKSKSVERA